MSTKTPPLSQLPSDCGNYVEGEIAEVANPRPSSTEQKIMIAGSFDSDKIQMIRELMEEQSINTVKTYLYEFMGYPKDNLEQDLKSIKEAYQQSK